MSLPHPYLLTVSFHQEEDMNAIINGAPKQLYFGGN
jgi:hypothetical protein